MTNYFAFLFVFACAAVAGCSAEVTFFETGDGNTSPPTTSDEPTITTGASRQSILRDGSSSPTRTLDY